MGLTHWTGERVRKRDVVTAKNYLTAAEIDTLNRIVVMFLDRAEFRAQRRKDIKTLEWELDLDKFLADTELPILTTAGSVSHELASSWAHEQYDTYEARRRTETEANAERRYLDDLTLAAQSLLSTSVKPLRAKKKR